MAPLSTPKKGTIVIFDNENQRKDFAEFVQKYPAPNAATGYNVCQTYLPLIQNAQVIPVEDQPKPKAVDVPEGNGNGAGEKNRAERRAEAAKAAKEGVKEKVE